MKSLNVDMNIVNCVLLFIVLLLVLMFINKQSDNFTNYIEYGLNPNCNTIFPCKDIEFKNEAASAKCGKNKFVFPIDIARDEFEKPFPNGMVSLRGYLKNNKFNNLDEKDANAEIDKYIKYILNKSCRKKNDNFCKLRFVDRFNKYNDKTYRQECNQWKYTEDNKGHEILLKENGESGMVCNAPEGNLCG